jgi:hypothetical protein
MMMMKKEKKKEKKEGENRKTKAGTALITRKFGVFAIPKKKISPVIIFFH